MPKTTDNNALSIVRSDTRGAIEAFRNMSDDQFEEIIQHTEALQESINTGVNALLQLIVHLSEVRVAALVGGDTNLVTFLAEYPNKLFNDVRRIRAQAGDLQKLLGGQAFALMDGDDLLSNAAGIAGRFTDVIDELVRTGNGDKLRRAVIESEPELSRLLETITRPGRSHELDPLTRNLGQLAARMRSEHKTASWPELANKAEALLIAINKRSADEQSMIDWFRKIGPHDDPKKQRKQRGDRLRECCDKWLKAQRK